MKKCSEKRDISCQNFFLFSSSRDQKDEFLKGAKEKSSSHTDISTLINIFQISSPPIPVFPNFLRPKNKYSKRDTHPFPTFIHWLFIQI